MLFYHTKLHCYIVVELKNTEYKPEYAGKLNFYVNAVNDLIRTPDENPGTSRFTLCNSTVIPSFSSRDRSDRAFSYVCMAIVI